MRSKRFNDVTFWTWVFIINRFHRSAEVKLHILLNETTIEWTDVHVLVIDPRQRKEKLHKTTCMCSMRLRSAGMYARTHVKLVILCCGLSSAEFTSSSSPVKSDNLGSVSITNSSTCTCTQSPISTFFLREFNNQQPTT